VPCGLSTDAERARHVRKRVREMLNSRGEWEPMPEWVAKPVREIVTPADPGARTFLSAAVSDSGAAVGTARMVDRSDVAADKNVRAPAPTELPRAEASKLVSILSVPQALEKVGAGSLCL